MSDRKLTEKQKTLYRLADFILAHDEIELMMRQSVLSACGTVGCIAGFAAVMLRMKKNCSTVCVADNLGLSDEERRALFFPPTEGQGQNGWYANKAEAAEVIRGFARTDHIDWEGPYQ